MDARYVNPFIASVKHVFQTMLGTAIKVGRPYIIQAHHEPGADISAVIGLSGDAVGCVVLTFPMQTGLQAASQFAGMTLDERSPDLADALGELANMVAGYAKAQMEGMEISISLPSVVIGREHVVSQSKQSPRLALPCDSPFGRFHVEIVVLSDMNAPSRRPPVVTAAAGP